MADKKVKTKNEETKQAKVLPAKPVKGKVKSKRTGLKAAAITAAALVLGVGGIVAGFNKEIKAFVEENKETQDYLKKDMKELNKQAMLAKKDLLDYFGTLGLGTSNWDVSPNLFQENGKYYVVFNAPLKNQKLTCEVRKEFYKRTGQYIKRVEDYKEGGLMKDKDNETFQKLKLIEDIRYYKEALYAIRYKGPQVQQLSSAEKIEPGKKYAHKMNNGLEVTISLEK